MKLNEFISQVLTDIDQGMSIAEQNTAKKYQIQTADNNGVSFDIAVTTSNANESKAQGQANVGFIEVLGAGVNAELNDTSEHNEVSRIQFTVFVPVLTKTEAEEHRRRVAQANAENMVRFR